MSAARSRKSPANMPLVLEGDMTIYNAIETKQRLIEALGDTKELQIDLSAIGEIDTAGFQLLLMIKLEAQRQQKSLRIIGHSPAIRDLFDFYNKVAFFGDPLHIPANEKG
jgi:anti-sigma B factor antagonist